MNKPKRYTLSKYRQQLLESAESAHAKARKIDSDLASMYYLGLEIAYLLAVVNSKIINKFIETDDTSN